MVWGEHDNRFKQLNSQLLKECGQLDWTGHAGHALQAFEDASAATWVDEDDVMAVTAQTSGQTLRQLTGNQQAAFVKDAASPRRAAAMAASARLIASVTPSRSASPDAALSDSSEVAPAPLPVSGAAEEGVQSEAQMSLDPSADIANLGHRDASTEQAEEAMRQLGSMDFTSEVQQMHSPDTQQHATSVMPPNPLAQSQVEPAQQNDTPQAAQHITGVHNPDAAQQSASTQVADTQGPVLSDAVNAAVTDDPATQYNQASQLPQQPALLPEPAETVSVVNSDATLEQQGPETDAADEQSVSDPAPMDVDVDDPALQRYRKAEAAVAHLKSEAGVANQLAALQTLLKILQVSWPACIHRTSGLLVLLLGCVRQHSASAAPQLFNFMQCHLRTSPKSHVKVRYIRDESAFTHRHSVQTCMLDLTVALLEDVYDMQNIVSHPGEPKYSQIRLGNPAFHSRAGQFAAARELLAVAGFTEEAAGAVDGVLVWKRHDQGLLWLTLSAVENAIQQVS